MPIRLQADDMGQSLQGQRLFRYVLTGGTAALVDLGGFVLFLQLSMPIALAGTASFALALLVNYALTARFVFKIRPGLRRLPVFALGALAGLCINMGMTLGLSVFGMGPLLAKGAGIGTAFLFNYTVNTVLVFRR